jgi:hypothetical protein
MDDSLTTAAWAGHLDIVKLLFDTGLFDGKVSRHTLPPLTDPCSTQTC